MKKKPTLLESLQATADRIEAQKTAKEEPAAKSQSKMRATAKFGGDLRERRSEIANSAVIEGQSKSAAKSQTLQNN